MKDNARPRGFSDLYAPVRPTQKHLQPRLPMADYVRQIGPEGLPKDALVAAACARRWSHHQSHLCHDNRGQRSRLDQMEGHGVRVAHGFILQDMFEELERKADEIAMSGCASVSCASSLSSAAWTDSSRLRGCSALAWANLAGLSE